MPVPCNLTQPNFLPGGNPLTGQGGNRNIVFRIPTPTFGAGLIEAIPDSAILANAKANATPKTQAGVRGHANAILGGNTNLSANDGTITRFGWKAQNKSLLMFSGEAYNVEMGVSNQLFPQERDELAACRTYADDPGGHQQHAVDEPRGLHGRAVRHRSLRQLHAHAGCSGPGAEHRLDGERPQSIRRRGLRPLPHAVLHHRPRHRQRLLDAIRAARCRISQVNLFSDLLVHHMGQGLADGITQGAAGPDEFRTAPLWGLGQRIFFLHDGRTRDLVAAIEAHSSDGSEANAVVQSFNGLHQSEQAGPAEFRDLRAPRLREYSWTSQPSG